MIYSHIKICSQDVGAERIRTEIKQKTATHEHQTEPAEGLRKEETYIRKRCRVSGSLVGF